jgi:8-oxo-dGTP pyrophosphatase MutT (NUDIX family)
MEYFELMDADGNPIGTTKERSEVHRDGDLHGGSHVWVVGAKDSDGSFPILLQKRRMDKDSFPGCLDVSCAGHVAAGETFLSTAIREMKEELNLSVREENLIYLFKKQSGGDYRFHGKPFHNREINFVYLLDPSFPLTGLRCQEEEIDGLIWKNSAELDRELLAGSDDYCIEYWELEELIRRIERMP